MSAEIRIDSRFCGPPRSGNGGYCAGIVASAIAGAAEVTLRLPPPLQRPLQLERGDVAVLRDGDAIVAEARPTRLALELPVPPTFEAAEAMSRAFPGFAHHPFPGCFVCGPARTGGDGLRIFPGRSPTAPRDEPRIAAPWVPDRSLAGADGRVLPEFLWAALDCPGYFSIAHEGESALLGRMTAEIDPTIAAGERCVVVAWPIARSGRKLHAGTALFDGSGAPRGRSFQTWIAV